MDYKMHLLIAFFIAMGSSFLLTYPVKRLAIKIRAVDFPNHRKIHTEVTPRLGGLAIYLGFLLGLLFIFPEHEHMPEIMAGSLVIILTGILDDKYTIRPMVKLTGQLIAASFLISSGLIIDKITLPFIGVIELGLVSVLVTVLWIVGITNAINLIDGLDGLATGVTTIALLSMFIMAILDAQMVAAVLCIVLIGANLGFLYHNFYPAKIYMGDTGSNFLGFMIAVVSILGLFKNIALFSFIIPVIMLAVPIFDTLLAIIRRLRRKQSIAVADNKHIHYRMIQAGYSHRATVLILYGFSALFGLLAITFSYASLATSLMITLLVLILLHLIAEMAGLVQNGKRPVIDSIKRIWHKTTHRSR